MSGSPAVTTGTWYDGEGRVVETAVGPVGAQEREVSYYSPKGEVVRHDRLAGTERRKTYEAVYDYSRTGILAREIDHTAGQTTVCELILALGLRDPGCCGRCVRDTARWSALAADARPTLEQPLAPALGR